MAVTVQMQFESAVTEMYQDADVSTLFRTQNLIGF